ncbi:MAG TPA: ABC transporter permease subunit [Bdellovibrionales bacterium]|nr:ABC transporter permease subunit [Bdellovibrionales bacterium]
MIREFWYFFRQNRGAVFGLVLVALFILVALFAPWIAPYDPALIHENMFSVPPVWQAGGNAQFLFGTDDVGRDLFSRLIYGARVSMGVGFLVVVCALSIGTLLGLIAGYAGGKVDTVIMRLTDICMALPSILLAIVVVTVLGQNLTNAIIAVSFTVIPGFVRLVRAQVMVEKNRQYVVAARTFGAGPFRQVFSNILPNCTAPIIVQGTLGFSDGILNVAALGFLGLGAKPPTAEWGTMLSDARAFIESAPWLVTYPGVCILVVVLGFNLLGDGLRDALDPRLKK